ncbi:MAG TPA: hypothetical protein VGQ02_08925, partial [Candidatus Limnocylindrales bacterium]|nr:hypothetical protein [Candidatus Limnocylindrales bacterium]
VTLDGVMQAPARPDEDRRGDFEHGGWATPYFDSVMAEAAGEGMAGGVCSKARGRSRSFSSSTPRPRRPA